MDACREQGVEEPMWRWDGGFVIVTFKCPTVEVSDDPSRTQVPPPKVRPKFAPSSPQVKQLIMAMADGYNTIRELAKMCGYQDPKHFRENYIKPALADGVLERLYLNHAC